MFLRLIFFLFISFATAFQSVKAENADSLFHLVQIAEQQGDWKMYFINQLEIVESHKLKENYQAALEILIVCESNLSLPAHPELESKIYNQIGLVYKRQNKFSEALESFNRLKDLNAGSDNVNLATAYSEISYIHQTLGNYEEAYEMQMIALTIREKLADDDGIARSNYILGSIFFYQENFEQALTQYQKSYKYYINTNEKRQIYSCLAAIGSAHFMLGDFEESKSYSEEALALAQSMKYKTGVAYALGNLASVYLENIDYPAAERMLMEAIRLKKEVGDTWGVVGSNITLGHLYNDWKKPRKAIKVLNESLEVSRGLKTKPRILECYMKLNDAYELIGDTKLAHYYLKSFVALQDSVLSEKTLEEMGQAKSRYEVQLKEHEIELLKKDNTLLAKDKKIQKLQTTGIALIAAMLLLVGIWLWNRYKVQGKLNNLLAEKNELLNSKNEEIFVKNKLLEQSNQDLTQFAYIASHDLKEPLRMIHSYTSLIEKRYKHLLDESGIEFMHFITDAVDRMKTLLDDLLDYSRAGKAKDKKQMINTKDLVNLVEANLYHHFQDKNVSLDMNEENMPTILAPKTQMLQLFQNLISNGIKFQKEGASPKVNIDCNLEKDNYVFSIRDNGIGISKENQEKVFEMFSRFHTRDEYEGTGIGLATCKRIVSGMGGDIWLKSEEGFGTTFYIKIPRHQEEQQVATT